MKQGRADESGNVLWFILLAVALLAVLTATISRSTDTSEQSGNVERFRIQASDIMRYSASMRETIDSMRLRGVAENAVSFENDFTSADYTNGTCLDCLVFGSAGGGAYYKTPSADWLDSTSEGSARYREWEFSGTNNVPSISSANPELIMSLGYLRQGLCIQINNMLGISNPSGVPPVDGDGLDDTAFQGSFVATDTIDNMDRFEAGCFEDGSSGGRDFTFYQVLIKR